MKKFFIYILVFYNHIAAISQIHNNKILENYYFKNLTVDNGLSNNRVFCIAQDSLGFIWFGTKDGLNRYDGYSFKNYKISSGQYSIGNNDIRSLMSEAGSNNIWVGTNKGLYLYISQNDIFNEYEFFRNKYVSSIQKDNKDNYWIIANHELYKLNRNRETKITYFSSMKGIVTATCLSTNGDLWISTTNGKVAKFDEKENKFTIYNINILENKPSKWIEKIVATNDQKLLLGTSSSGLLSFDINTQKVSALLSKNKDNTDMYVRDILIRNNREYWIATESGIYVYDAQKKIAQNINKQDNFINGINDNAIYSLLKDNNNNIWIGTYFNGIKLFPNQAFYFGSSQNEYSLLNGNIVREIIDDKYKNLWVGTEDNGIFKIPHTTRTIQHITPGNNNSISYNNIHGLLADDDTLWIGTFERGIDRLNIKNNKVFEHIDTRSKNKNLKSNFIITFLKSHDNKIYVGTGRGLQLYDKNEKLFKDISNIPGDFIYSLIQDLNNIIWIGTESNGVYYLNTENGNTRALFQEANQKNIYNGSKINCLFHDSLETIFIGTEGEGIISYNTKTKQLKKINGLGSDFVFKILKDDKNNIWASTAKGLVKINPVNNYIYMYTKEDGLLTNSFNYNSGYKHPNGTIYFGSINGFTSFNPKNNDNNFDAPLYITNIFIYDKEVIIKNKKTGLTRNILYTKSISLPYNKSSFSIEFASLDYTQSQKIKYAYTLENLDDNWTYLNRNRSVYYSQLAPGKYTFKLKTIDENNNTTTSAINLNIEILPPWWLSNVAYAIYILFSLITIIYLFYLYHQKQIKLHEKNIEKLNRTKEKEIIKAKIDFFTNIAHEIKNPLTLIKGPVEDLIEKQEKNNYDNKYELTLIEKNTNKLIELTSELLNFRNFENNELNIQPEVIEINQFIKSILNNFEYSAKTRKVSLSASLENGSIELFSDKNILTKIVNNICSNAIKYAESYATIEIKYLYQENSLRIIFKNDGVEIGSENYNNIFEPFFRKKETSATEGSGVGLSIAKSLTTLLHGSLIVNSSNNENIFILTVPDFYNKD